MFGIGVFVFFITVYGVVVAGGLQLTSLQIEEQPEFAIDADDGDQPHGSTH